jgi:DnaJ-class molecular chaperone
MATQMLRQRIDSPERWAQAFKRATTLGLEVFVVADTGERLVTSASQLDTLHRTDGDRCSCKAGLAGDPVCCHRAVVRFVEGRIAECGACAGCGVQHFRSGDQPCPACYGTGVAPDTRLRDQPPIEIAA